MIAARYLRREITFNLLAVSLVLLVIIMGGRLIKYLAEAAEGKLDPGVLFSIMAYRLPGFLELILPLGLFLGILLGYGRLYLESEMTVLHACGIGRPQVLRWTLKYSLLLAALIGLFSLVVTPWGLRQAAIILQQQSSAAALEHLTPGRFQKSSDQTRVTYIERLGQNKGEMENVFIAMPSGDGKQQVVIIAKQGRQQFDNEQQARYWVLQDGYRYQLLAGQLQQEHTRFSEYGARVEESTIAAEIDRAETLSTLQLLRFEQPERDWAHLQWRLSLPLMVLVVTLLAIPLAQVNPRQGRFAKLIPSILLYLAYLFLLSWARTQVLKGRLPAELGLVWIHLLFLALGAALMWGPDWWRERQYRRMQAGQSSAQGSAT
ncbi:LPS export ABC transporter permease LptF [Balneatrix alpica]|uniref:LPS export ABC transporter permease LptF n=1 Tax=Balneatrix alpica TaxID=75684 RepID=UPI00273865A6|nr:LPS export ABC transporter permease LptF [Balneatrix alpica]